MVINKRKYIPVCTKFQTSGKFVSDLVMKQFLQITDQYLFYQFFSSKILERLTYNMIIEFINENGLLYKY